MRSPIFGGDAVSRSVNFADNQLWNLYPEILETRDGKSVGALYGCPGLDLKANIGNGPIRGMSQIDGRSGTFYAVSGPNVYSLDAAFNATLLGSLPNPINSPVSMVNNGTQMIIFDGIGGYLIPGGYPLTGGAIGTGGTQYAIGDTITLLASDGTTNATAQVEVSNVSAGGIVTAYAVTASGAFNPQASAFTQKSSDGSGSGFTLVTPTYGPYSGIYTVPLPFTGIGGPVTGVCIDGFGLVNVNGTQRFYQSALKDLSIWPVLNFSSADATPDNLVAIAALHREAWMLKERHLEVWVDAGQPGVAFQRFQGVATEFGCIAPFSPAKVGESLIWLGQSEEGTAIFVITNGYNVVPISTQALDYEIQKFSTVTDAVAYAYQQGGHLFYVVSFPSANATFCYDLTASSMAGYPIWHRRAAFSNGQMIRHRSNCHLTFGNTQLVGDYLNGNIYAFNLETYTDNGSPRKWLRSWRALKNPNFDPTRFSSLLVDMETGTHVPAGTDPQVALDWSDDGGNSWSNEMFRSVGKTGETAQRVKFNRLGSTRKNKGLDRIFRLSSTDQFRPVIMGAELT